MARKRTNRGRGAPAKQASNSLNSAKRKRNRTKKQRGAQRRRAIQNGGTVNIPLARLSPCATQYLMALADPWKAERPCIPDVISTPSSRFMGRCRGTFTIGTGNCGWAACCPFMLAINNSLSAGGNHNFPVVTTGSTFAGANFAYVVSGGVFTTTGVVGNQASSMFTYNTLIGNGNGAASSPWKIRLVGAGLRVRYTGTELNRGGRLLLYRTRSNVPLPGNSTIGGTSTISSLLQDTAYESVEISRSWKSVNYIPDQSEFLGYMQWGQWDPLTAAAQGFDYNLYPSMIALVEGGVSGQNLEFDAIGHFELVAPITGATHSDVDPIGFGAVLSSVPPKVINEPKALLSEMAKSVGDILSAGSHIMSTVGL